MGGGGGVNHQNALAICEHIWQEYATLLIPSVCEFMEG